MKPKRKGGSKITRKGVSTPPNTLSTSKLAKALGVTPQRVRQLRLEGKITALPLTETEGVYAYPAETVSVLTGKPQVPLTPEGEPEPPPSPAEEVLAAFALFASGATLPQVVEALRILPARVRALFREWSEPLTVERQSSKAREARAKASRAIDVEYEARLAALDKDAPKVKKRSFEFVASKGRERRREEAAARVQAIKDRLEKAEA